MNLARKNFFSVRKKNFCVRKIKIRRKKVKKVGKSGDAARLVLFKTPAAGRKRSLKAQFLSINLKISHGSRRTGTDNKFKIEATE